MNGRYTSGRMPTSIVLNVSTKSPKGLTDIKEIITNICRIGYVLVSYAGLKVHSHRMRCRERGAAQHRSAMQRIQRRIRCECVAARRRNAIYRYRCERTFIFTWTLHRFFRGQKVKVYNGTHGHFLFLEL